MRRCLIIAIVLLIPFLDSSSEEGHHPTLIIAGAGINSSPGTAFADQVYRMFNVAQEDFHTTNLTFQDGRVEEGDGTSIDDSRDRESAAQQIGTTLSRSENAVLKIDMRLDGFAVTKSLVGLSLLAAGANDEQVGAWLDGAQTKWNDQTERAATYIREAAVKFKEDHPDGKVIVIGHSAFTNAIDLVPTEWHGQRIVDLRVMSSPMVRNLRHPDLEHTIFVTHHDDFPSANMGSIWSRRSVGELAQQGVVIQLQGTALSFSPFTAHSETHCYTCVEDMKVTGPTGTVSFRGAPADLILAKAKEVSEGKTSSTLIGMLRADSPKESRVGGITLTKPADIDINPADVLSLSFSGSPDYEAALILRSGEKVALPRLSPGVAATALKCIYFDRPPEVSLFTERNDAGVWDEVPRFSGNCLNGTELGDLLLMADLALARVANGNTVDYEPASLTNYHPFAELSLDNELFRQGKLGGRVWLVPSSIQVARDGSILRVEDEQMAIRMEFYPMDRRDDYYSGRAGGQRDPAGDFLASQLTEHYPELEKQFGDLGSLRDVAAYIGILLWARNHNISPDADSSSRIVDAAEAMKGRALGVPSVELQQFQGVEYPAIPSAAARTVSIDTVARPAVIFNEYGPSRFLWTDGTQSTLEYSNGVIDRLVSRYGTKFKITRGDDGHLFSLTDDAGAGLALATVSGTPIVLEHITLGHDADSATITDQTTAHVCDDDIFDERISAWIGTESRGTNSLEWLLPSVPQVTNTDSPFLPLTVLFLFGFACILLMQMSQSNAEFAGKVATMTAFDAQPSVLWMLALLTFGSAALAVTAEGWVGLPVGLMIYLLARPYLSALSQLARKTATSILVITICIAFVRLFTNSPTQNQLSISDRVLEVVFFGTALYLGARMSIVRPHDKDEVRLIAVVIGMAIATHFRFDLGFWSSTGCAVVGVIGFLTLVERVQKSATKHSQPSSGQAAGEPVRQTAESRAHRLTGVIYFRSVPIHRKPRVVRVYDRHGNFLGTSTQGYTIQYDFSSVEKNKISITKAELLNLFLGKLFLIWLTISGAFFFVPESVSLRVATAIVFVGSLVVRYALIGSLVDNEIARVAAIHRKKQKSELVCVREEDWDDWRKKVAPYGYY